MNVTTKEMGLLKDMQAQEKLCIKKYDSYASSACSEELRGLLHGIADVEREHLQTVSAMMTGEVKPVSGSGSTGGSGAKPCKVSYSSEDDKSRDAFLCNDLLTTEKHVSALYNTGIFEFSDAQARNVLNHIQKEEQQHGLSLYEFMSANGMTP